jgi:maltose alpha-D-glucosyltransferase/alpha-amylase
MLGNDRRRLELAYALQFSLRGTPVLRYGEEIGMGEDLALPGRQAIRTPMQWSLLPNGGFSSADPDKLVRPVVSGGEFGYETVNVTAQRHDPQSLLSWFERMIRTLREAPEVGAGSCTHVDVAVPAGVLAHRADGRTGCMLFLHNLGRRAVTVDLGKLAGEADHPNDVLADQEYPPVGGLDELKLAGYGYRWIRLNRRAAG